jgi:hypothetical protein
MEDELRGIWETLLEEIATETLVVDIAAVDTPAEALLVGVVLRVAAFGGTNTLGKSIYHEIKG